MSSSFSAEREELRAAVRSFLEDSSPESAVRAQMRTAAGYDPTAWAVLARQLGLLGLAIPEAYGGAGFGFAELAVVFEEMGRGLFCGSFLATVTAGQAILTTGDADACAELLPPSPTVGGSPRSPSPSRTAAGPTARCGPARPGHAAAGAWTAPRCSRSTGVAPTCS